MRPDFFAFFDAFFDFFDFFDFFLEALSSEGVNSEGASISGTFSNSGLTSSVAGESVLFYNSYLADFYDSNSAVVAIMAVRCPPAELPQTPMRSLSILYLRAFFLSQRIAALQSWI